MLISTNYDKVFGFFVPSNFKIRSVEATPKALLAFYWINQNSELATSQRTNSRIYGDGWDYFLIDLSGVLTIRLNRSYSDWVGLRTTEWVVKQDSFNYPGFDDWKNFAFISGGGFTGFSSKTIEFFKVQF